MGVKEIAITIRDGGPGEPPAAHETEASPDARAASSRLARFLVRRRTSMILVLSLLMIVAADGSPLPFFVGVGLLVLSQALRVACMGYIDKDKSLSTGGPFSWTRNPLYLSNMIGAIAFLLMCGRWEFVLPVIGSWFLFHLATVASEEEFLRAKFGEQFEEYCRRVPRWLPRRPQGGDGRRFSIARISANKEYVNLLGAWLMAAVFYIEMVK